MALYDTLFNFVVGLLDQSGYVGIFVLMAMESATLPVPSEVVLPLAGYLVYKGSIEFWAAVIVATIGSLVGTLIDYGIGHYLGRPAILRYGRFVRLNEKHLQLSEKWFGRYGSIVVLLARFVPLVRTLVAFPAGIANMKVAKFVAYSAAGIFAWDVILIYLGMYAGANSQAIADTLHNYFLPIGVVAVAIVVAYFALRLRSRGAVQTQDPGKNA